MAGVKLTLGDDDSSSSSGPSPPTVTDAMTSENVQTTSGLAITRDPLDTGLVTDFQITNITGGTLYQHDGVTAINNGDFISVAEGAAGLKFTPAADSTAAEPLHSPGIDEQHGRRARRHYGDRHGYGSVPSITLTVKGPFVIAEGKSLKLSATGSDSLKKSITYSWDVNGDGVFGDASGASPHTHLVQTCRLGN